MTIKLTLTTLVLSLGLGEGAFAQQASEKASPPDAVMQQVVTRILRYQFKPRREPATIPLAEDVSLVLDETSENFQIKPGWLPAIKNIAFELVPEDRIPDHSPEDRGHQNQVFVFDSIEVDGNTYTVSVGWRDKCAGEGTLWKLRVDSEKVRLWPIENEGWGSVYCDTGPLSEER